MTYKRKYPKGERGYDMTTREARELTGKQKAFIRHYLSPATVYNGSQSAIAAGYSKAGAASSAHENLKNPIIEKEINQQLKQIYASQDLTVEAVVARLEEARRAAMRKGKHASAIRAIELQGKYLKMFVDRIEHQHTVEDANTDELVEMLKSLVGNVEGLSFDELMESVGGPVARSTTGNGPKESGLVDSEGAPPAD